MGYLSGLIPAFTMAFRCYSPLACSRSDNNFCLYLLVDSASFSGDLTEGSSQNTCSSESATCYAASSSADRQERWAEKGERGGRRCMGPFTGRSDQSTRSNRSRFASGQRCLRQKSTLWSLLGSLWHHSQEQQQQQTKKLATEQLTTGIWTSR